MTTEWFITLTDTPFAMTSSRKETFPLLAEIRSDVQIRNKYTIPFTDAAEI